MTTMDAPLKKAWMTVADLIARDVRAGSFAPGTWLKQIDLEQRYGFGRPDIRRALDYLTQKRLVQHVPNRGYHVVLPDSDQTAHILELRVILETAAVDSIVANATPAAIAQIDTLARTFDEMILNGTVLDQYEANLAFHRELLSLCSNPELSNLVTDLRSRTSSALAGQWSTRARVEQSSREHHAMIKALEARDAQQLKDIIALHIRQPKDR
ncbi:GntR family transcriptional regulator [Microvirga sp. VF16]|uniref:GntR family transcriptional regulator n=1 Tax=Microvirga sp. VF16 TaxID=2807101 RepID=UPI00193E31AD|nr:GntR family transcriptional regulator [Microvirga sp. VF16]QRM30282.1 GntR family transcriptional regulator [Microvirga sp. VF16]